MGQYWRVFNIDKMETLDFFGLKMGEWFFSSCTTHIVQALYRDEVLEERDPRVPLSGSWAGDRIICLGDYARVDDLPRGLFSAEELKDLGYSDSKTSEGDEDEEDDRIHSKLANVAKSKKLPDMYSNYSAAVLRNLSKKEYIRGSPATPGVWKKYDGWFSDIGTKFFSMICWSSDETINMMVPDGVELSRGRWAGDRFDLAVFKEVEEELEADGWKDVTQEVGETVSRIRKQNFNH